MDIIREDFFHFLWENLHFKGERLLTTSGDRIHVVHPGYRNNGDGPDYRYARIRKDEILLYGDVELHKKASEWYHHGHDRDSRYERVMLHIVLHDDLKRCDVKASDGHRVPTLELYSALPASLSRLWRAYHRPVDLPCSGIIGEIPRAEVEQITANWDKTYFEYRLDRVVSLYDCSLPMRKAWQRMLTRGIFQGLGYHKNQDPMLKLADFLYGSEEPDPGDRRWFRPTVSSATTGSRNTQKRDSINASGGYDTAVAALQRRLMRASGSNTLNKTSHTDTDTMILKRSDWDFSASRPANQPHTRILQAAELYYRLQQITVQQWLVQPVDTIWGQACLMRHSPPLGKNRKEVIFHNIVLPSCYLLGRWIHKKSLCASIRDHWDRQHIPMPGRVQRIFAQSDFPAGKHQFKLATLHHFKYFCTFRRCRDCEVMKYAARA